LKALLQCFPPAESSEDIQKLIPKEFDLYQLAKLNEEQLKKGLEDFWIETLLNKDTKIKNLATYFIQLLTLPHTTAEIERVFSLVKLTKTPNRNRMKTETLEALITTKNHSQKKNIIDLYPRLITQATSTKAISKDETVCIDEIDSEASASDHENDMYDAFNADDVFDECDNEFPDDMKTLPF